MQLRDGDRLCSRLSSVIIAVVVVNTIGNFIPSQERIALWDLETDYYLHIKSAPNTDRLMRCVQCIRTIVGGVRWGLAWSEWQVLVGGG